VKELSYGNCIIRLIGEWPSKGGKMRERTMQNHHSLVNGSTESSGGAKEHRNKSGHETQAGLEDLRLRLTAVIATVARLEQQSRVRQWFGQAERELLELLRGEVADVFTVTITCAKGRWFVVTRSPGVPGAGAGTKGEGASFPQAWHDRSPLWS
jgi:hypothetical protein